jgi:hypothetical protein
MSRPPKKPAPTAPREQHRWAIYRLKGTPAALLGHVEALDETRSLAPTQWVVHRSPYSVKRNLLPSLSCGTNPHLASFACGGLSARVPSVNVSDVAS